MSKNISIFVGIAIVGVLALVALIHPVSFGGIVHNAVEHFVPGLVIGDAQHAGCFKVEDTDKGGYSYITYLNGTEYVTASTGSTWTPPAACAGL